jgi:hypothetical protein
MLASTVQFSNNTHQPHPHPDQPATSASRISAIRNNHTPAGGTMVLFQTPNSVFRPGPRSPPTPALSRRHEITASPTR